MSHAVFLPLPLRRTVWLKAALLAALATGLALPAASSQVAQVAQVAPSPQSNGTPADGAKVMRYAFPIAETSFDPAQISDLYSRTVVSGIFDAPLEYAYLARPVAMRPNTLAAMPEVSADFRSFTFRVKPGIHFADDPAFKGARRELIAADYVYSLKRHYDPRWKSQNLYLLENDRILGLSELRKEVIDKKIAFDYERDVEGLRVLDRYTFRIRIADPKPRFLQHFVDGSFTGAVAREVVEAYGDRIGEHPVGTGPFRLAAWKRSSKIVLEKNPNYREVLYDETPVAGDARLAKQSAALKGQRLPLIDRVEIAIVEETQPRWLSYLNEEADVIENVPAQFIALAAPNDRLAPHLAKRGMQMVRYSRADVAVSYFGMENPVVGGHEPHKVALRRAISLAVDVEREIRLVRHGQATLAQGPVPPGVWGYDPAFKTELGDYSLPRAKALLDLHGYVDKDGDGWRDQPDGKPLLLEYATSPDQLSRSLVELWQKNMTALGIRIEFKTAKWPENLKSSRAGKLMMWGYGWTAGSPDADTFLALGYGPNKGGANHSRFNLPAFNAQYEKQRGLPDGPERLEAIQAAAKLMVAYMPYKIHVHRIWTDLAQPWVIGYDRNIFVREWWKYVDVDPAELRRRGGAAH